MMNLASPNAQRLSLALIVLLVLAIVWLLGRVVWLVVAGPDVAPAPMPPVPRIEQRLETTGGGSNLFGSADRPAAPAPVRATPLNLRLLGVVSGDGGYAIIRDGEGREGVFRIDDELPGGARLDAIEARRVILVRDGRSEALELPEGVSAGAPARPAPPGQATPAGVTGVSAASFPELADRLRMDRDALAGHISILPVAGGGFRVRPGRDADLFTSLGLHANDVVLAVNGQPLNSEADVMALFGSIDPSQRLAITVRRGERELVLTPDLDNQ